MKGKPFTQDEINYLIEHYPHEKTIDIANALNKSIHSIYHKSFSLKLTKSDEFLKSTQSGRLTKLTASGVTYRFPKGHVPANKGKKMDPENYERVKHTFFKKGHISANTSHNGCITVRNNKKRGTKYLYIRLDKGKWVELHRYLWEKKNGKIPKGYNVIFKDNDHSNFSEDNFQLITDAELLSRNSIHNYPQELKDLIHTKAVLTRQINKLIKDEQTHN